MKNWLKALGCVFGVVAFRNVPVPGVKWTPVSVPPGDTRTVLLTSVDEKFLYDANLGPAGLADFVWTGFFTGSKILIENRCEGDTQEAKFWRDMPA